MRFLKQYKGQILLTGILFVILIAMPFSDTLERSFPASAFQYPNEVLGYVREENGSLIVPGEAGSFALYTENMYLKEGAYNVAFQIVSFSEGSSVEIYDPTVINPDNTTGKLLAAAFLSPEEDTLHLPFVIDSYVECIQIRVVCKGPLIIQNTTLRSESRLYWDPYIYAGLLLLGSVILLLLRIRYQISTPALVLLAFAALWSSLPLCCDGLFNGHDLYFHYGRLFTLSESLLDGQFPVRIHSSMYEGMGYLCPIFYPESMLYPFALLEILGLSPIGCYKLLLVCINFATAGVSCYAFSRLFRSDKIGTIAAFLYTLSLYRFINMYTRAAVGELLAAIFLPLLLLGMYELFLGNYKNWWIAAFSFTALLQTHIISTVIAVFFSIVFALCFLPRLKEFKRVLHLLLAACTTVLLNVWFLVPLLDHMQFSVHTLNDVRGLAGYSLFAIQFFDVGVANPTATAEGPHTPTPEMPYSIGIVLLIGILLYVFASLRK